MDNQPVAQQPQPAFQPVSQSQMTAKKPKKLLKILLALVIVGIIGALGYFLFVTHQKLVKTQEALTSTQATLATTKADLDKELAVKDFIATNNTAALSKADCAGQPLGMFDVHLHDKYGVYRYLCANGSFPIRIAAFQKDAAGMWTFTYGASATKPTDLPGYIFNSDPDFFGPIYGAKKF